MKLINKINLRYLIFSSIVLLLLGIAIQISMQLLIAEETDEKLVHTSEVILSQLEKEKKLISLEPYVSVETVVAHADTASFSNLLITDEDKEGEEFRQYSVIKTIENETYRVTVRESAVESEDLLEAISLLILVSLSLLLVMLYLLNRAISKNVWSSFYTNLEKLKQFSITELTPFVPEESNISEFKELNSVVRTLTEQVIKDYEILKQFSEDASHELQTPLAVIRSKIESLLDGNSLSEDQTGKIQSIYNSVNKLSKINKGLLLITKIGNNQFSQSEHVIVSELVEEKISFFSELAQIKSLQFSFDKGSEWVFESNKYLFDILLNNLFFNGINHSITKGEIKIELNEKMLSVSNPGVAEIENRDRMFERFAKGSQSGSVGLGLAISKQICTALNLHIDYHFENGMHVFSVNRKL